MLVFGGVLDAAVGDEWSARSSAAVVYVCSRSLLGLVSDIELAEPCPPVKSLPAPRLLVLTRITPAGLTIMPGIRLGTPVRPIQDVEPEEAPLLLLCAAGARLGLASLAIEASD